MSQRHVWLPHTTSGFVAIGLSIMALLLWVLLPMVTVRYRDIYPITDSWVMPTFGGVVSIAVALFNIYEVWWHKQRAWLNIIVTVILGCVAIIALMVLVGGLVDPAST
ncbi:MAG: hypothetical protein RI985_1189 [Chloroflexota bacterium]